MTTRPRKKTSSKKAPRKKRPGTRSTKKIAKKKLPTRKTHAKKRSAMAPDVIFAATLVADRKLVAVVNCVNSVMDANHHSWNDNGVMNTDYHYVEQSMAPFLATVRSCLAGRYTFNFDRTFVLGCLPMKVYEVKRAVYGRTT